MTTSSSIALRPGSITIHNQPVILITSSLFYFRIPADEWRGRMRILRKLGYNAIDVYFPWNYHEVEPGCWDFKGERDVQLFLKMAREEGLWVVARPGPYICSEWDGGSIPAWLNAVDLDLRQNSVPYLEAVEQWYRHILPILARFQIDREGTIILVQIENELDFFDCTERTGMMEVLRNLAFAQGITVPLIACAGQGDLRAATGDVEGVCPTCNFYFESSDPEVEERVRHYSQLLREKGYPLCVTETNRSHTELRRLLAGGAKLLGPYLQTGGTDFGYSTSITNWGDPLAFLTSHYDLGGMVSPGGKVRPEGCEALIFTKILTALSPEIAIASPLIIPPIPVHGLAGQALEFEEGGHLIALANLTEKNVEVQIGENADEFPQRTKLEVSPNTCPFVLLNFPLKNRGIEALLRYSTLELVSRRKEEDLLEISFAVDTQGELVVEWPHANMFEATGWLSETTANGWRLWLDHSSIAEARFIDSMGNKLILKAISRDEVGDLEKAGFEERQICPKSSTPPEPIFQVDWQLVPASPCSQDWFSDSLPCNPDNLQLEKNDIHRGVAFYRAVKVNCSNAEGLLIQSGADILSLYADSHFLGTVVPGGGESFVPLPEEYRTPDCELVIRAEIWGHSNFDDHRLPALRLKSLRGMSGLAVIFLRENITNNWFYQPRAIQPAEQVDSSWPYLVFGGWSTTDEPARGVFHRDIALPTGMDTFVLYFPGIQMSARVFAAGHLVGIVNPHNPFVNLSAYITPGTTTRVAIAVEQDFRVPAGQVWMHIGKNVRTWELAAWGEKKFHEIAQQNWIYRTETHFPLVLTGGDMAWLHAELPSTVDWDLGWDLQFEGDGFKASAWVGDHLTGRIWVTSEMRPHMKGGADDRMVLPASWLRQGKRRISLLIEAVCQKAELRALNFILDR